MLYKYILSSTLMKNIYATVDCPQTNNISSLVIFEYSALTAPSCSP